VQVRRLVDPAAYLNAARELLLADEARHNLLLGLAGTLRDHPHAYPEFRLWLVEEDRHVVGAALQTPPFNLLVARPARAGVLAALAQALRSESIALPGVTAAIPEANEFAEAWCTSTSVRRRPRMEQRIYRLTELQPVAGVPGRPRHAVAEDRTLLVAWVHSFSEESMGEAQVRSAAETVDARLQEGMGGFLLWEDREPVSVAGWGASTPNGVRIGPVYTPPEHRRRGYGSAVTAAVSAEQLAAGRGFCFLYTDLANPTSNRIYANLGYEPVCDSIDYAFEPR
jgi:GNAT superfamily N-acetyltransferase